MRRSILSILLFVGLLTLVQPANAQDESSLLAVGESAPDFTLPGATRYGVLQEQVSLSDYREETVVLAFFFRARTRG